MKDLYNWWEDPNNQERVKRISWWNHEENKEVFHLPISVVKSDEHCWVATCNDETKKYLGELHGCAQGKTKEEAIEQMFVIIKISHNHSEDRRLNYQRWVPFRKGDWKHTAGKWFVVFGIHINFRYGKGMKGGRYLPFTKLNISILNEWLTYTNWKRKHKE